MWTINVYTINILLYYNCLQYTMVHNISYINNNTLMYIDRFYVERIFNYWQYMLIVWTFLKRLTINDIYRNFHWTSVSIECDEKICYNRKEKQLEWKLKANFSDRNTIYFCFIKINFCSIQWISEVIVLYIHTIHLIYI